MTGDMGETLLEMPKPQIFLEQTLAIIKPGTAMQASEEIEDIILRSGYTILKVCITYFCLFNQSNCRLAWLGHHGV